MKVFNLIEEIIVLDKETFLDTLNSNKEFGINIKSEIVFAPFQKHDILIYKTPPQSAMIQGQLATVEDALKKKFQWLIDEERILIKAAPNWNEIITLNKIRCSYDDSTGYGVASFMDMGMQEMGWHASEFNLDYRDIVTFLEEHCEGTILCIATKEPFMFHGLGFFADTLQAKKVMHEYCQTSIKKLLAEGGDCAIDNLSSDQADAAEYFDCL